MTDPKPDRLLYLICSKCWRIVTTIKEDCDCTAQVERAGQTPDFQRPPESEYRPTDGALGLI